MCGHAPDRSPRAEHLRGQAAGFQAVVDAFAVERVDAGRGVADQHPVPAGHAGYRAAHRQQRRRHRARLAFEAPLVATQVGVIRHQRSQRQLGRPLRRRQRAHADVHFAVAQREDPAVAGQHRAVGGAQLQMRSEPGIVAARRGQIAAGGDAIHRLLMPPPAQHPAQCRAGTVGDDQLAAPDLRSVGQRHRRHPRRRIMMNADRFDAESHPCAGFFGDFADPVVEFDAGHRAAGGRERRAGPFTSTSPPNPLIRRPRCRIRASSHSPSPSRSSSATARGVSPSPQALSRGKFAASMTSTSRPALAAHAAAADPAGPAPTTTTSALLSMLTSMLVA